MYYNIVIGSKYPALLTSSYTILNVFYVEDTLYYKSQAKSCTQDQQHLYTVAQEKKPIFVNFEACNNALYITI